MKKPMCARVHSNLPQEIQTTLERAYQRARAVATRRRIAGGQPVSDAQVAQFVEVAVETAITLISTASAGDAPIRPKIAIPQLTEED